MKKIVIAGGTGFIGQYLQQRFTGLGYDVRIISRQAGTINWNDKVTIIDALENATMLINLAGKSVDCRYNEQNKKAILQSRTETTAILGAAVLGCKNPPGIWFNSSTATYYRHSLDRPMTETTGEKGSGFSVDVATAWEDVFFSFTLPATRQVALRMAIVLGQNGGAIKPLLNLVKYGLGGKQGNGQQMFSWIHIEDLYRIIDFVYRHNEISGVINCSSPEPVTNKVFMQTIRKRSRIPIALPAPAWLLSIGAVLIRTETELILKSRWVLREKLLQNDFVFKFPTLDDAITDILKN